MKLIVVGRAERMRVYGELERTEKEAVLPVMSEENYRMSYLGRSLLQPGFEPCISRKHVTVVIASADLFGGGAR